MAEQLLHYNQGCTKVTRTPVILDPVGTASVGMPLNQFFFYSNNPEPIDSDVRLADGGYWLAKEQVTGNGRVFLWHQNAFSPAQVINEALVIFNPNAFDIRISAPSAGIIPPGSGVDGWFRFFQGGGVTPITVPAGQFGNLFSKNLTQGQIYGVVASLAITDTSGNPASAILYDLAWRLSSGGATQPAIPDGTSRVRGLGDGYNVFVNITPMNVTDALVAPQGFTVAANTVTVPDSFHGSDLPFITDWSPPDRSASGPLQGCYGATYVNLTWGVNNDDTNFRTVTFLAGLSGNTSPTNLAIK